MIFVDSSFWIAETLPRDGRHRDAAELARSHSTTALATSTAVLGETWTYLRRRKGHVGAMRWLDYILDAPRVEIAQVDASLEGEAWTWLRRHDERPYSFVDATSFALMRKLRISDALAFGGDFAAAGFNELRA